MCPNIHCFGVQTKDRGKTLFHTGHRWSMSSQEKLVIHQPMRQMTMIDKIINNEFAHFFRLFDTFRGHFQDAIDQFISCILAEILAWWAVSNQTFSRHLFDLHASKRDLYNTYVYPLIQSIEKKKEKEETRKVWKQNVETTSKSLWTYHSGDRSVVN